MKNKKALIYGLEKSFKSASCRAIEACQNRSFVHDMKEPNDLDRKVNASIMVVGSSPGKWEDKKGRPLLSKKIDSSLEKNGLTRNDVYFTDVVKCRLTSKGKDGKLTDRKPIKNEVEACLPLLEEEIKLLRPKAIIAMGHVAIKTLTGEPTVRSALDKEGLNHEGIPVFPTYHPRASTIVRDVMKKLEMRSIRTEAFEKAKTLVDE